LSSISWYEHEGNSYHHLCKITEVIPLKKIGYTWRDKGEPGDSPVTIELLLKRTGRGCV